MSLSNADILEKAIDIAEASQPKKQDTSNWVPFNFIAWYHEMVVSQAHYKKITINQKGMLYAMAKDPYYKILIFDHSFAKALWGREWSAQLRIMILNPYPLEHIKEYFKMEE